MYLIDKLAEKKIADARDRGELENLPGSGKPLALDDESSIPEELRAGYRILKNSGFVPPEVAARAEIKQLEDLLRRVGSRDEKEALVIKLSLLKSQL